MATIPKTKTTNKVLFDTIRDLRKLSNKTGVNVWKAVAAKLAGPASQKPKVNLGKIDSLVKDGESIIIAGKVLGDGTYTKKITIVAFAASESAIAKIEASGSKFLKIKDYIADKPDNKIRIIA